MKSKLFLRFISKMWAVILNIDQSFLVLILIHNILNGALQNAIHCFALHGSTSLLNIQGCDTK